MARPKFQQALSNYTGSSLTTSPSTKAGPLPCKGVSMEAAQRYIRSMQENY